MDQSNRTKPGHRMHETLQGTPVRVDPLRTLRYPGIGSFRDMQASRSLYSILSICT